MHANIECNNSSIFHVPADSSLMRHVLEGSMNYDDKRVLREKTSSNQNTMNTTLSTSIVSKLKHIKNKSIIRAQGDQDPRQSTLDQSVENTDFSKEEERLQKVKSLQNLAVHQVDRRDRSIKPSSGFPMRRHRGTLTLTLNDTTLNLNNSHNSSFHFPVATGQSTNKTSAKEAILLADSIESLRQELNLDTANISLDKTMVRILQDDDNNNNPTPLVQPRQTLMSTLNKVYGSVKQEIDEVTEQYETLKVRYERLRNKFDWEYLPTTVLLGLEVERLQQLKTDFVHRLQEVEEEMKKWNTEKQELLDENDRLARNNAEQARTIELLTKKQEVDNNAQVAIVLMGMQLEHMTRKSQQQSNLVDHFHRLHLQYEEENYILKARLLAAERETATLREKVQYYQIINEEDVE